MEYGVTVWGYKINSYNNRSQLESAQRYSLKAILKAPPSTPTSAMEVELNITPIDIRLEELQRLECIRICRKPANNRLKKLLSTPLNNSLPSYYLSRLMEPLYKELSNTYGRYYLEPEPSITTISIQYDPKITIHNMGLNIGLSHSRSTAQQELGRNTILNQLNQCGDNDYLLFTDGSALSNPGPTGSAVNVMKNGPNSAPTIIGEPISSCSDNFHGEINAVDIASHHALTTITPYHTSLRFFIDCHTAISAITTTTVPSNHHTIINKIKQNLAQIQQSFDIPIHFHWTPAHCHIPAHDSADRAAKHFAKVARHLPQNNSKPITVANARLSNLAISKILWNRRWKLCSDANLYKHYTPDIDNVLRIPKLSDLHANTQKILIKLRINHTSLPAHKARYSSEVSPLCDICETLFDIEHLFF